MFTLITGGARSGKSSAAERLAGRSDRAVHYVATAEAGDDEMTARIERHRADRPPDWVVHEEPVAVADELAAIAPDATIVVDCLGLWVTNLLDRTDAEILAAAADVARTLRERSGAAIVVTNEVGSGVVPEYPIARRFRDLLGLVNQAFAAEADAAYVAVSGRLLALAAPEDLDV